MSGMMASITGFPIGNGARRLTMQPSLRHGSGADGSDVESRGGRQRSRDRAILAWSFTM